MLDSQNQYWRGGTFENTVNPSASNISLQSGKQGSSMYENDKSPIPSLPGSGDAPNLVGGAKVPVHLLPPGAKQGDTVPMKISYIDQTQGVAHLVSATGGESPDSKEGSDVDESGTGTEKAGEPSTSGLNTGLLLGPMSNLKNYLAKKSVEVQSQVS